MNKKELYKKVDEILWNDWDPIGINDCGPDDEYQGYVPSIVKLLEGGADEIKITKFLHHHANVSMGLSTKIEAHKLVAEKLKDLRS